LYAVKRQSVGELAFPIGVGISAVITQEISHFIFAMWCLGVADTLAQFIGVRFGKHSISGGKKSLEGFAAAWLAALIGTLVLLKIGTIESIAVSGIVAACELIGLRGIDNITIPVGTVVIVGIMS
jgi:dolichol kinase